MAGFDILNASDLLNLPFPGDGNSWLNNHYTQEPTPMEIGYWGALQNGEYDEVCASDSPISSMSCGPEIPSPEFVDPSLVKTYAPRHGAVNAPRNEAVSAPRHPYDKSEPRRARTPKSNPLEPELRQQDDESQSFACWECKESFENILSLDRHTRTSSHKAWKCHEPGCPKSYLRRDVFLRHRLTHTNGEHSCQICTRTGKKKVFKRKDHLKEHMRNCHFKKTEGTNNGPSTPDILSFQELMTRTDGEIEGGFSDLSAGDVDAYPSQQHQAMSDGGTKLSSTDVLSFQELMTRTDEASESGFSEPSSGDASACSPQQHQAMKELMQSLGTVLGDRHPKLISKLEDKMTALSGPDMESVAENMAGAALAARTYLITARPAACSCPCGEGQKV